jgi:hypothetical protein
MYDSVPNQRYDRAIQKLSEFKFESAYNPATQADFDATVTDRRRASAA